MIGQNDFPNQFRYNQFEYWLIMEQHTSSVDPISKMRPGTQKKYS